MYLNVLYIIIYKYIIVTGLFYFIIIDFFYLRLSITNIRIYSYSI